MQDEKGGPAALYVARQPVLDPLLEETSSVLSPCLASVQPGLHFSNNDTVAGPWHSFYVGISGELSLDEESMQWPNQVGAWKALVACLAFVFGTSRARNGTLARLVYVLRLCTTNHGAGDPWRAHNAQPAQHAGSGDLPGGCKQGNECPTSTCHATATEFGLIRALHCPGRMMYASISPTWWP